MIFLFKSMKIEMPEDLLHSYDQRYACRHNPPPPPPPPIYVLVVQFILVIHYAFSTRLLLKDYSPNWLERLNAKP